MSVIETVEDVNNKFLSRREITCNFNGLAGRLQKLEAANMVTKELKLDGIIIPVRLKNQVGKPIVTGTFYVYENEELAKKHVNPSIFARLEKAKAKLAEKTKEAEAAAETAEQSEEKQEENKE